MQTKGDKLQQKLWLQGQIIQQQEEQDYVIQRETRTWGLQVVWKSHSAQAASELVIMVTIC